MSSTESLPPFNAYKGKEAFLFVSYAHKDASCVFPELELLRQLGVRLWYDEGIDPGNEWPEEVASALAGASMFLVFISPNAVASRNVRNEINFALTNHKPFLAVHLVETELPPGLQLRMGDIQALLKYRMTSESYRRKIETVLPQPLRFLEEFHLQHPAILMRRFCLQVIIQARKPLTPVFTALSVTGKPKV